MKNMIKLPAIVLGLMLLLTGTTQRAMAQDEDVSLQTFYDELSPYGTWYQDPDYGYVWRPDVGDSDFRPYYTDGRWAMTEYGNTWVSDYDWGWAPFHYGRWVTDRYNQWLWIPDTTWGPAWVSWRSGGGYYGWAPLGPRMGVSVNFGFSIPDLWWCFVPQANIYYSSFPRYYSNRNYGILGHTTYITNVYVHNRNSYYTGPRRDDIRRVTHQDVRVYNINRTERPGRSGISNNDINLYRPRGGRNSNAGTPAPRNVAPGSAYSANRSGRGDNRNDNRDRSQGRGNDAVRQNGSDRGGRDINKDRSQTDAQRQQQSQQRQQQIEQQRQQREGQGQPRSDQQRQQTDQQRQQQSQQRQQQTEQQRQQREAQGQQRSEQQRQQTDQQRQQQRQQREAQGQQRSEQQRQQADQQRQQQTQQRQQADQQRQQQAQQQRQQADQQKQQQAQQQRQQADQQKQQQAQQQRQQADQQRQQQAQQQRQQADQQRQQQTQQRQERAQQQQQQSTEGRTERSGRN